MSVPVADIVRLAKTGMCAAEIGSALGASKNAIIGRAFRAGVVLSALNGNVPGGAALRQYHAGGPNRLFARTADFERRRLDTIRARYARRRAQGKPPHFTTDERVELLALSLVESRCEIERSHECSDGSLARWSRNRAIFVKAKARATVIAAERAEEADRALTIYQAELAAEAAERSAHNAPILGNRPEREQQMARSWEYGATMQQIGDAHGVSRERIRQILTRLQRIGARFDPPMKGRVR